MLLTSTITIFALLATASYVIIRVLYSHPSTSSRHEEQPTLRKDGLYISHYYEAVSSKPEDCTILMFYFLPRQRVYMIELRNTSRVELEEYRQAVRSIARSRFTDGDPRVGLAAIREGKQLHIDFRGYVFTGSLTEEGMFLSIKKILVVEQVLREKMIGEGNFIFIPTQTRAKFYRRSAYLGIKKKAVFRIFM